jgi:xylulokinase
LLLAVDIGTSTFKAAVFSYEGLCRGHAALPLAMASGDGLRHETDPARWLRAFEELIPRLEGLREVEALIVSGNGPTLTPVTGTPGTGEGGLSLPAGKARLWLDRRAREESKTVSDLVGSYVDPSFFVPKALGIKNREPELYEKTRYFLSAPEYLVYALTGEARTVFPSAGFERWYWDEALLRAAGLDPAKFPPFAAPGDLIGTLDAAAAARFGFSRQVKVFAGAPDFFVSILGTGTVNPGQACDRSGTSEGVNLCTESRIMDGRLMSYGHPIRPYWNLSGIISTSGKAIGWVRELLGMAGLSHRGFYDLAAEAEAGAGGLVFLPYLEGERAPLWDSHARGAFQGLSLSTGRAELARAAAEGVCFAIRDVITVMEERGAPVRDLRVTGGPAESPFLNQLKADVSGRPVLLPVQRDAELLGLAVIGAYAQGRYASMKEAAGALVRIEKTFYPNESAGPLYENRFGMYRELYQTLKPYFEKYF